MDAMGQNTAAAFSRLACGVPVVVNQPRMKPAPLAICAVAARVLLGCWFLYSGGVKVFASGLDRFTRDIANYKLVGPPLDAVAAYSVPWFEMIAGLCLLLGFLRKGAMLALAGLVVVFALSIGWAWFHQLDISCGCHGGEAKINYWGKAAEFAGYFLVLGWLWRVDDMATIFSLPKPRRIA
jgi:uncharacterized membrane protein YphA (DoxX/SURF4 family)